MTELPQRKSPRLKDYDYTQAGAYFVTICTHDRKRIFGHIDDGEMILSDAGVIARDRWLALPNHHPHAELDFFVMMPNHMHGIIILTDENPVGTMPALSAEGNKHLTSRSLGTVVGSYKSSATRHIRQNIAKHKTDKIWQPRYHDHIIRNPNDLHRLREYVLYNPARIVYLSIGMKDPLPISQDCALSMKRLSKRAVPRESNYGIYIQMS